MTRYSRFQALQNLQVNKNILTWIAIVLLFSRVLVAYVADKTGCDYWTVVYSMDMAVMSMLFYAIRFESWKMNFVLDVMSGLCMFDILEMVFNGDNSFKGSDILNVVVTLVVFIYKNNTTRNIFKKTWK